MLSEYTQKVKDWYGARKNDVFVALVIFLTSIASFGLGRLSLVLPEKTPIQITNSHEIITKAEESDAKAVASVNSANTEVTAEGRYVASKNGTAYHFPWCSGAARIKEENKVWFQTKEEAEKAGYHPAANCDGL